MNDKELKELYKLIFRAQRDFWGDDDFWEDNHDEFAASTRKIINALLENYDLIKK